MPKPVPLEKREEFRAHYLTSGNASESARAVKIPERTGRDIAAEICKDPEFAEERRALRAQYLDELVILRMKMARKAFKRFDDDAPIDPEAIDKRPDYGRLVADAEKNAHNLAKIEKENDGGDSKPTEVHITVSGPPSGDEA